MMAHLYDGIFDSVGLKQGLRVCSPDKFPNFTVAADPGITF